MADETTRPMLPIRMLDTWAGLWISAARVIGELTLLGIDTLR